MAFVAGSARYTHALPEDIEHGRQPLDTYLSTREQQPEKGQ